jgi:hypothetical protein
MTQGAIALGLITLMPTLAAAQSSADTVAAISASLSAVIVKWNLSAKDTVRVSPYFYEQATRDDLGANPARLPMAADAVRQASTPANGASELATDEVIRRCNRQTGDCLRANGKNIVFWFTRPRFDGTVGRMSVIGHATFARDERAAGRGRPVPLLTSVYEVTLKWADDKWAVTSLRRVAGS